MFSPLHLKLWPRARLTLRPLACRGWMCVKTRAMDGPAVKREEAFRTKKDYKGTFPFPLDKNPGTSIGGTVEPDVYTGK